MRNPLARRKDPEEPWGEPSSDIQGEVRERMHEMMALPDPIALGIESLQEGDDLPLLDHERRTRWLFGKPYYWVVRAGIYTLHRGESPYEAMSDPQGVLNTWLRTAT